MADRADFDVNVLLRAARLERVPARAVDRRRVVVRMNAWLHIACSGSVNVQTVNFSGTPPAKQPAAPRSSPQFPPSPKRVGTLEGRRPPRRPAVPPSPEGAKALPQSPAVPPHKPDPDPDPHPAVLSRYSSEISFFSTADLYAASTIRMIPTCSRGSGSVSSPFATRTKCVSSCRYDAVYRFSRPAGTFGVTSIICPVSISL